METAKKIRAVHAYRLALVRGLTAKQACAEYGIKHTTLFMAGKRAKLPALRSEYLNDSVNELKTLSDEQLVQLRESMIEQARNSDTWVTIAQGGNREWNALAIVFRARGMEWRL